MVAKVQDGARARKDPNSKTQRRNAQRTAENLRDDARAFRDLFVIEYLKDFNATHAYKRAGGKAKNATKAGYDLRHEAYVSHQIQHAIDSMKVQNMVSQQTSLSWMIREANTFGPDASHGARVSAISHLMKAAGLMDAAKDAAVSARGGVMVVPGTAGVDDWEAASMAAQQKLKEEVRK